MEKKSSDLAARKLLKRRKPKFLRQDGHKKLRLGNKWRKPKGIQNKMRLKLRGYRRNVSKGFKSPRSVRGMSSTGLEMIKVFTKVELDRVDPATLGVIVASTVGKKKRLDILKSAIEKNITIINFKDPAMIVKNIEDEIMKKTEAKKKLMAEKEKKKKEAEKKAEEKKKKVKAKEEKKEEKTIEDKLEETKKKEKKEKDKILTKKQ